MFFVGIPGTPGAERFFPSDAKRYLENAALWEARAPFMTRPDWGTPVVELGKLGAIENEAPVFIGQKDSGGQFQFLRTPPNLECFLEPSGWKSADHYADLDRLAARYAGKSALTESQFWYHAEFFDAARLRRLFGDAVDPGNSIIDFNDLFNPRPDKPAVLIDPALICYYLFYPGHDEALGGCIDPNTGMVINQAREFGSFAGEWSCVSVLLDRTDPSGPYAAKWAGLSNRNVGAIQVGGREVRSGMRLLPWSAMQTFEGNHARIAVALGSHALYLPGETPPPVVPLTSNDPATAFCGSATPLVDPYAGNPVVSPALDAMAIFYKVIAGAAVGFGIFGPIGSAIGAIGGAIWGIAEAEDPARFISIGVATPSSSVDTISNSGFVVHPIGKRPAEVDPARAVEWKNRDDAEIEINGRRYDWKVDRETQVLWGDDPDGQGYTGRWGPRVEEDAQARRAGMKFPKFWEIFFDALVRNDPPSRLVFLTVESGASWTVPADWNSSLNSIECIGGGGGGGNAVEGTSSGGGGGGGGYSKVSNVMLTPGATVTFAVGVGGGAETSGGATYFCNSASNCASIGGSAVLAGANEGGGGSTVTAGAAASAVGAVGSTITAGGSGGAGGSANGGGGGGGAAGPNGAGGTGGGSGANFLLGGGGGGGNGGGSTGETATTPSGAAGGHNNSGSGAGATVDPGANGSPGTNGGGGSGSGSSLPGTGGSGGKGGNGTDIDPSYGSGGGGGGAAGPSSSASSVGGNGGLYGGGGGGGSVSNAGVSTPGSGAAGIIVIRYTPA